ncbi:hypothetical protein [Quadrisphaera sp. KR29]|uniref:hypothetical protein n=1 Tax=Quadrisphaera sp. KR29 TaxID=3461391 RepID=UPI004044BA09
MELSERLHDRVQLLVAEYAGALPPGRVIAVAVAAAAQARRPGPPPLGGGAALDHWEESARRRLSAEVAEDLARVRRQQSRQGTGAA